MEPLDKASLRRLVNKKLAALPEKRFLEGGKKAAALLCQSTLWEKASAILAFLSMPHEIETELLIRQALSSGKVVYVPRVEGECLSFYRIYSMDGPWQRGPFAIREPSASEETRWIPSNPALILCPGLAFDRYGARLGRGKGYYDRFLATCTKDTVRIGICLGDQLLPAVPFDRHDIKVQYIVSDGELIDCTHHS